MGSNCFFSEPGTSVQINQLLGHSRVGARLATDGHDHEGAVFVHRDLPPRTERAFANLEVDWRQGAKGWLRGGVAHDSEVLRLGGRDQNSFDGCGDGLDRGIDFGAGALAIVKVPVSGAGRRIGIRP